MVVLLLNSLEHFVIQSGFNFKRHSLMVALVVAIGFTQIIAAGKCIVQITLNQRFRLFGRCAGDNCYSHLIEKVNGPMPHPAGNHNVCTQIV